MESGIHDASDLETRDAFLYKEPFQSFEVNGKKGASVIRWRPLRDVKNEGKMAHSGRKGVHEGRQERLYTGSVRLKVCSVVRQVQG